MQIAPPGLKGLAVADTELGAVRGEEGFYHYRQHNAAELARTRTLEDVWTLQIDGGLPPGVASIDGGPNRALPEEAAAIVDGAATQLEDTGGDRVLCRRTGNRRRHRRRPAAV